MTEFVQHERPEAIQLRMECLELSVKAIEDNEDWQITLDRANFYFDYMAKHYQDYEERRFERDTKHNVMVREALKAGSYA